MIRKVNINENNYNIITILFLEWPIVGSMNHVNHVKRGTNSQWFFFILKFIFFKKFLLRYN